MKTTARRRARAPLALMIWPFRLVRDGATVDTFPTAAVARAEMIRRAHHEPGSTWAVREVRRLSGGALPLILERARIPARGSAGAFE